MLSDPPAADAPEDLPEEDRPEDRPEDDFEDVAASDAEEDFDEAMRNNVMDLQAHDADADHMLDFDEFCALVREREVGDHTDEELASRFKALDADGSGKVDMNEYILFTLRDALGRASKRVIEMFKEWDDDGSGTVGKAEFRRAVHAMGFQMIATDDEIDMTFDSLDADGSGSLEYKELNKMLRVGAGSANDTSLPVGEDGKRKKYALRRRTEN
eukprot:4657626-Prymnesium_polylepis.1